jgi:type VI secretion system protein ImpF
MANLRNDRLAPPLMHAFRVAHEKRDGKAKIDLRDDGGDRVIAARRLTARTPISESGLRREVLNDVTTVMNTINLDSAFDLSDAPHVRDSILNFGFPDLTWRSIDENRLHEVSKEIEIALTSFEPRLAPNSIQARRDVSSNGDDLKLRFLVKADLRARPVDVPVEFIAEVEMDSGKIKIDRI